MHYMSHVEKAVKYCKRAIVDNFEQFQNKRENKVAKYFLLLNQ